VRRRREKESKKRRTAKENGKKGGETVPPKKPRTWTGREGAAVERGGMGQNEIKKKADGADLVPELCKIPMERR